MAAKTKIARTQPTRMPERSARPVQTPLIHLPCSMRQNFRGRIDEARWARPLSPPGSTTPTCPSTVSTSLPAMIRPSECGNAASFSPIDCSRSRSISSRSGLRLSLECAHSK
jgi:hypothetical protein